MSRDDYKPLWWCVRFPESNEWKLFDSSAKLAGFKSGAAVADSFGLWQMEYEAATDRMDSIRRKKEKKT